MVVIGFEPPILTQFQSARFSHCTIAMIGVPLPMVPEGGGGCELLDFYDGGDHVHIWGLKFRKDEHISGLRF